MLALNYLLFVVYLLVLCWLMIRVPFIKSSGISNKYLIGFFLLKVLAGIAIGWISLHFYGQGNDYWDINREAWKEYQLLVTEPGKYFTNIFTSDYPGGYSGIFSSFNSYWNDLRGNIIIKLVSVFNIFSRGDYYINSLFFNTLIFSGHVILYKLFIKIFPGREKLVMIGCFLLPSTLYFTSGIHKDGIVFLMLAILVYSVYQSLLQNKLTVKRILLICLSLLILLLVRNFVFLALIPALVAWIISAKTKWRVIGVYSITYLLTGLLVFNIGSVFKSFQPLKIITNKQTEYLNLPASDTKIELTPLQPELKSFALNAPEALNHVLLRPYLWELPVKSLLPLSIELALYQLLFLFFLFYRVKELVRSNTRFILFTCFFTFTVFLLIGYIVPNLGSIVRYRSLYLPFIITPLLCGLDIEKLKNKIM